VKFIAKGHSHDLTADRVRTCLRDETPNRIEDSWVEVDGVKWPVTQVLAAVTADLNEEIDIQTGRRSLGLLGFPVRDRGGTSHQKDSPGRRARSGD
jgi:hypothetical protein